MFETYLIMDLVIPIWHVLYITLNETFNKLRKDQI